MQRARPKTSTGLIFLENFDYQSLFLAILFSFDLESKTFSLYSCESKKKGTFELVNHFGEGSDDPEKKERIVVVKRIGMKNRRAGTESQLLPIRSRYFK